ITYMYGGLPIKGPVEDVNVSGGTYGLTIKDEHIGFTVGSSAALAMQAKEDAEAAANIARSSGIVSYETKADMEADTDKPDHTTAMVTNDTASNNGYYRYDSGTSSWVKRYEFYATTLDPAGTAEAVTGKAVEDYITIDSINHKWVQRGVQLNATEANLCNAIKSLEVVGANNPASEYIIRTFVYKDSTIGSRIIITDGAENNIFFQNLHNLIGSEVIKLGET